MRFYVVQIAALALLVGHALPSGAQARDAAAAVAGAKVVSADDVAKAQSAGAAVIDARAAAQYSIAHIKGAINIPYHEKSKESVSLDATQDEFNLAGMPFDRAAPIVIYCDGAECWKASMIAIRAGYTNVLWYRDGFPNWVSYDRPTE